MSYNYQDAPRESQQEYFGKVHTDNKETLYNALKRIEELEQQIEKMKCCGNCKSFKGYGETCEGWGEPVLNLNCDCTEWELRR